MGVKKSCGKGAGYGLIEDKDNQSVKKEGVKFLCRHDFLCGRLQKYIPKKPLEKNRSHRTHTLQKNGLKIVRPREKFEVLDLWMSV